MCWLCCWCLLLGLVVGMGSNRCFSCFTGFNLFIIELVVCGFILCLLVELVFWQLLFGWLVVVFVLLICVSDCRNALV